MYEHGAIHFQKKTDVQDNYKKLCRKMSFNLDPEL